MTAPLSEEQLAEMGVPSPERLREVRDGMGAPLTDDELTWLRGDAGRYELHIRGAQGGHFPMSEDLPGAVVALAQRLGAAVAEVDRLRGCLDSEERESAHQQAERVRVQTRVAELEAERHETNEALSVVSEALRAGYGTAITEAAAELERRFILSGDRLIPRSILLRFLRELAAALTGGAQ